MARNEFRLVLRSILAMTCLAWPAASRATNHLIQIDEVSAADHGDRRRQFVEMRVADPSQTNWTDRAELVFFDARGREVGTFPFLCNPVVVTSRSVLIATAEFAAMPGAPTPDFIMPALVEAPSGQVCFRSEHGPFPVNVCLAYGQFTGEIPPLAGPAAPALPVDGSASLQRVVGIDLAFGEDEQRNADFALAPPAPANTGAGAPVACSACGNGVVEPNEQCDDGNLADGDCCSSTCTSVPRGDACADDGDACTDDVCDGHGLCAHGVDPCRRADPVLGCVAFVSPDCVSPLPRKSSLSLTSRADADRRKLTWSWAGAGGMPTSFGSPLTVTDYFLCVYEDRPSPALVLRAVAPAAGACTDGPCWSVKSIGFTYADRLGTPAGVTGITLRSGNATKLTVKGKGPLVDMPALPLAAPIRVQLKRGDDDACWEATYPSARKATTEVFKAKSN